MKRERIPVKRLYVCSMFLMFLLFPSLVVAAPLSVQTVADSSHAQAGESGADPAVAAVISVVVTTRRGEPVADLGSSVGNGTSAITLPAGWTLGTMHVTPGGCLLTPTFFLNGGFDGTPGAYLIGVVPFTPTLACEWLSGEYHYVVQINTDRLEGSGLGKLTIP